MSHLGCYRSGPKQNRTEPKPSRSDPKQNRSRYRGGPESPMQGGRERGPERPRKAQRWSREPRELTEPKQSIHFTEVFAYLKPGPEIPSHRDLKKDSPPAIWGYGVKMWRIYVFNAMRRQTIDSIMILSAKLSTLCPKGLEEMISKMMNLGRGGPQRLSIKAGK